MRVIREIEVAGLKIQVKELTVGEIRAWLKEADGLSGDVVDVLLFEDMDLPGLRRMTSLDASAVDTLPPSAVREIIAAAREVNADFFAMRDRVMRPDRQAPTA